LKERKYLCKKQKKSLPTYLPFRFTPPREKFAPSGAGSWNQQIPGVDAGVASSNSLTCEVRRRVRGGDRLPRLNLPQTPPVIRHNPLIAEGVSTPITRAVRTLLALSLALVLPLGPLSAQGEEPFPESDDPFGSGGAFKPQVETGGSYSPHNGNGTRSVQDLEVPGATGAGLDFTRHWNSTDESFGQGDSPFAGAGPFGHGGWTHSWNWVASLVSTLQTPEGWQGDPPFSHRMFIKYPDGRTASFESGSSTAEYWTSPDWMGTMHSGDYMVRMDPVSKDFWLYASDGSAVLFRQDGSWQWHGVLVIDPNGLKTLLSYNEAGELQTVRGQDNRELRVTWERVDDPGSSNWARVITRVESGVGEGSQGVVYSYVWPGGNGALGGATYLYKGQPVPDEASTYTYQWWNSNNVPNTQPGAIDGIGALLTSADDSRFEGTMTRIKYIFRGGPGGTKFSEAPNCQNPVPPYGPYLSMVPFPVEQELSWDGTMVSKFYIPDNCKTETGTRTETNGLGAKRMFYYGRASGPAPGMPAGSEVYNGGTTEPTKITQFASSPTSGPAEFRIYDDWLPVQAYDARGILTNYEYEPSFRNDPFWGGAGRRDGTSRVKRIHHAGADNSSRTFDRTNSAGSAPRDAGRIPNPYKQWLFGETDGRGNVTRYHRNGLRLVTDKYYYDVRLGGGLAAEEHFTYNEFNDVVTHTLPSGAVKTNTYYPQGHPWYGLLWKEFNSVDGEANATIYTYDALLRVETISHAWSRAKGASFTVKMTYNARHQVVKEEYPATNGGPNPTKEYSYDRYGNCTGIKNELGAWSTYTYDDYRRCTSYTEPLNAPDWNGGPNVPSRRWDWMYDRWIDNVGHRSASSHTSKEWRIQIEPVFNDLGERRMTARSHDIQNRLSYEETGWIQPGNQPLGNWYQSADLESHRTEYDAMGNKSRFTDSRNRVTTYEYDKRNRLTKVTEPLNRVTETLYDTTNNKTLVKFPIETAGQRTQQWLDYDAFGQAWRFIDERGNTTNLAYQWGPMKKLDTVTTHRQRDDGTWEPQPTNFEYDGLGRRVWVIFPDNSSELTAYNSLGLVEAFKNRKNQTKRIYYDARGREDYHTWDGNVAPGVDRTWDAANRLTNISNSFSYIDFKYDDAGQVWWEGNNITGSGGRTQTTYYRYPDGNIAHLQYPNGTKVRHDYTARGQLKEIFDYASWKRIMWYAYHLDGKVAVQVYANSTTSWFDYDERGFMKSVEHRRNWDGPALLRRDYSRDNRDRITVAKKGNNPALNPMEDGREHAFSYDAEGQLYHSIYNGVKSGGTYSSWGHEDYFQYDALGNRQAFNLLGGNGWTQIFRRDNGLNQYSSWSASIIYHDDNYPGWGPAGNGVLMADGWITASYNALNQPVAIWSPAYNGTSNFMWFGYDPLGRCVKRWVGPSGAASSNPATYFYYNGWNLIQEGPSATSASRVYFHGGRVDEIVATSNLGTGQYGYHHYDARGDCLMLSDSSQNILEQYHIDAFGRPFFYSASGGWIGGQSPFGNRFLFTGREWLQDLKLYDFRHRLYQPELGRFLQPDPKHFAAGDYNLYRYCHNDPVNKTDPTGLDATWLTSRVYQIVRLGMEAASQAHQASKAAGDGMERGKIGVENTASGKLAVAEGIGKGTGIPWTGPQRILNMPKAPQGTRTVVDGHNHTNNTPMSADDKKVKSIMRVMTNDGRKFEIYIPAQMNTTGAKSYFILHADEFDR
jgi:RHS repeat-associated protein